MRPALWCAVALTVGIAAAEWLRPHPVLALVFLVAIGLWAALARGPRAVSVALLLTLATFGALRYSYDQTAGRGSLLAWQGQQVEAVGTVVVSPELRRPAGASYHLAVERVNGNPASGRVQVTQWRGEIPGYGERVALTGRLKPPLGPRTPGAFDQEAYLQRQGIYLIMDANQVKRLGLGAIPTVLRAAVWTRLRLEGVLKATLPHREAALMAGLLFGSRSDLPTDIAEAFRETGVFHLLAVSGGNIAMILLPWTLLLRRTGLSGRVVAIAGMPLVIFFVFLTGASPSVLRAGLMAVLLLLGVALGRERDGLNLLGAAAAALLIWSPRLLFDIGFQLSAVATLGILLFTRPVAGWLTPWLSAPFGHLAGNWLSKGLAVTLAAQLLVEPLSLYHFGRFTPIAPIANLMVLIILEPLVQVGMTASLVGTLYLPLAWLLNLLTRMGLWLMLFLVKGTAAIPGASLLVGKAPAAAVVAWYVTLWVLASPSLRAEGLALGSRAVSRWTALGEREKGVALGIALLLLLTAFSWRLALAEPLDTLTITFLNVGQGDAVVIQSPGGAVTLIDAGPASPPDPTTGRGGFDAGETVILPYLEQEGVARLAHLFLTHPHQDHAGGLPAVLAQIPVGQLYDTALANEAQGYVRSLQVAVERGVPVRRPVANERILLGGEVWVEVLHPEPLPLLGTRSDENSNSIVLLLHYRQVRILLTGDMEAEVEERLLARDPSLRADLLKVAHHGSQYSSTLPFLRAIRPRYAIISAGAGNLYGHPDPSTLRRLEEVGAVIYRTDLHGSITVKTTGQQLTVKSLRAGVKLGEEAPVGIWGRRWFLAW